MRLIGRMIPSLDPPHKFYRILDRVPRPVLGHHDLDVRLRSLDDLDHLPDNIVVLIQFVNIVVGINDHAQIELPDEVLGAEYPGQVIPISREYRIGLSGIDMYSILKCGNLERS